MAIATPNGEHDAALDILYHADLDGQLATPRCGEARPSSTDYASLVSRIESAREDAGSRGAPTPLVLFGGNGLGPDLFAAMLLRDGDAGLTALVGAFAQARYDALALGRHDLAVDRRALLAFLVRARAAGMPTVVTNLRCESRDGARELCAAVNREVVLERAGTRVGVIATLSPRVLAGIDRNLAEGLVLEEPLASIRDSVARLRRQRVDRVVLMMQPGGSSSALSELYELQQQLGDGAGAPDVILAAGLADPEGKRAVRLLRQDGAPAAAGSTQGTATLTHVAVPVENPAGAPVDARTLPVDPATRALAVAELLDRYALRYCAEYGAPAAPARVQGSLTRSDLVRYLLEVMRRAAGAEIALVNDRLVKAAPFPLTGTPTRAQIYRALPYRAVLGRARLTGAQVASLLGPALSNPKLAAVGLDRAPDGGALKVNGRALDQARHYVVATIEFVAQGGDGIIPAGALRWRALPGRPDLRDVLTSFLAHDTAGEDGDPTINVATDFGEPARDRPLLVTIADLGVDLSDNDIQNTGAYTDPQLTRTEQRALKAESTVLFQLRAPRHEGDARLNIKYGYAQNRPPNAAATGGETADLITLSALYAFQVARAPSHAVPQPYARLMLESELTRPPVTATQTRDYHHAELTNTYGAVLALTSKLKIRGGPGLRKELLAPDPAGRVRFLVEAGATLDPTAIATVGPLAVRLEGLLDYNWIEPSSSRREHQLRGTARISVPVLPLLFVTAALDGFAVERAGQGWGTAIDLTAGIRLHLDAAYQRL